MERYRKEKINSGITVALIQARMGSTRLPRKMLRMLGPHTLIEWVVRRVKECEVFDRVVLATSDRKTDDPLVEMVKSMEIDIYRGSESDVLGRVAHAARKYKAETVIRICADNPFVDPGELKRLFDTYVSTTCDYACNHQDRLKSKYADGFGAEILSNKLLQEISKCTRESSHREHVTLYLWDNKNKFKLYSVDAPIQLAFPNLKFDIDTEIDLARLNHLVEEGVNIKTSAKNIVKLYHELS